MSYISELQIDGGAIQPIGSSLYGTCNTGVAVSAKVVTLNSFDTLINGTTIHVKFLNGNTAPADSYFTLAVGNTNARRISNPGGNTNWSAGAVISFTYDGTEQLWIVNDSDSANVDVHIENFYNSNSTNAISGQGVADALGDLDGKGVVTNIIDSGNNANNTDDSLPTTAAVAAYVNAKTEGITGAMHFIGRTSTTMSDGLSTATITLVGGTSYTPNSGDVVLSSNDSQEYVWVETNANTHAGWWELLGDEGSYALKTNTAFFFLMIRRPPRSTPTLTSEDILIPNVTDAGSATTMLVEDGVLKITIGSAPSLGTSITATKINSWNSGSAASLSTTTKEVVVPRAE